MRYWKPQLTDEGWIDEDSLKLMFPLGVGRDVKISPRAMFHGTENVKIGDNVRIDDGNLFLCSRGHLNIGGHVHLAANSIYSCGGGIDIGDHVQIGFNVKLVSASDNVKGEFLIGPVYPSLFREVTFSQIKIGRLSVVLMGSCLLPGTILEEGVLVAPLSQTQALHTYEKWNCFGGVPCKGIGKRERFCENRALQWEKSYALSKTNQNS